MPTAIIYDTETTGLPLWHEPSDDPRQPHIVQLAAALIDVDTGGLIAGIDLTVEPDGWTIPDDVARVHGITTARAQQYGVPEATALLVFADLWAAADLRVAHNESFDARIIRIALKRHATQDVHVHDAWSAGEAQCTARMATPVCALPPTEAMRRAGRTHHKTPNLAEAFRHFFGRDPEDQHSAGGDVKSCMAIWFALRDMARRRSESANDAEAPSAA